MLSLIPISDANPTKRFPIITILIIALNVIAFFFVEPGPPGLVTTPRAADVYFVKHAPLPCQIENTCPTRPVEFGRGGPVIKIPHRDLLSFLEAMIFSTFLHANILHIGGNMLFFWVFGNNIEDFLGRFKFVLFYLLGGLASGFAQVIPNLHPLSQGVTPAVGASGAIAAVMGAYILLYPRARVRVLVPILIIFWMVQMPAVAVLGVWLAYQVLVPQPGVAWQAHVGGFVFGLVTILLLGGRPQRPEPAWRPDRGYLR